MTRRSEDLASWTSATATAELPDDLGRELEAAWERDRSSTDRPRPAAARPTAAPAESRPPVESAAPRQAPSAPHPAAAPTPTVPVVDGLALADLGARIVHQIELRLEAQRVEYARELAELTGNIEFLTAEVRSAASAMTEALKELHEALPQIGTASGAVVGTDEVQELRRRVEDLHQLFGD